jgi:hypothetical protein
METMSPTRKIWVRETGAVEKRDLWSSLKRGFRGRCPRCGKGKLFRGFLKVDNRCSMCGLDFTPHRADDLPAYLVIVIVGRGSDCASDRNGLLAPSGAATSDLLAADGGLFAGIAATGERRSRRAAMGAAHARL